MKKRFNSSPALVLTLAGSLLFSPAGLSKPIKGRKTIAKKVVARPAMSPNLQFDLRQLKSKFASWGIDPNNKASINLLKAWKKFKKKKDIVVAVVDTGIDPKHPFLKNNMYVKGKSASMKNYGVDFSKNKKSKYQPIDQHGHGTHVTGIVKSIYPEVKILTLKYYNPHASGQDNLNSTIAALRYAVKQNVDVINYSGGGPEPALEELRVLKEAEKKGILVIAAAGNEESNIDVKNNAYYPASYGLNNIITVTAHDQSLRILSSSNYGKKAVDIFAPGYRIKSALPQSRAGYLTGTSQATAFVSGVAALLMSQYPKLNPNEIKEIILASARKEITMKKKCSTGGRLDATRAQELSRRYLKAKSLRRTLANFSKKKVKWQKLDLSSLMK
jgi:subtilisin family serine protease